MATTRNEGSPTINLLRRAGLDPRHVRNEIRKEIGTGDGKLAQVLPLTPRTEIILALTIFLSERDDDQDEEEVAEVHLLMAILQEGESIPVRKLLDLGFDLNGWLQRLLLENHDDQRLPNDLPIDSDMFAFPGISDEFNYSSDLLDEEESRDDLRMPTPLLDKYGRDLTAQAAAGRIGPAIAREAEIRALARTLAETRKITPCCWEMPGLGKQPLWRGWLLRFKRELRRSPCSTDGLCKLKLALWSPERACVGNSRNG